MLLCPVKIDDVMKMMGSLAGPVGMQAYSAGKTERQLDDWIIAAATACAAGHKVLKRSL